MVGDSPILKISSRKVKFRKAKVYRNGIKSRKVIKVRKEICEKSSDKSE